MTLSEGMSLAKSSPKKADVVIGEDWVSSSDTVDREVRDGREKRGFITLHSSPLARKIITFNLIALIILVVGLLYVDPFRTSLVVQRERGLINEARLIANVFEARQQATGSDMARVAQSLDVPSGVDVFVFDDARQVVGRREAIRAEGAAADASTQQGGGISDMLDRFLRSLTGLFGTDDIQRPAVDLEAEVRQMLGPVFRGDTRVSGPRTATGGQIYVVATPIEVNGEITGAVAIATAAGEIDAFVRSERERVLRMFLIAMVVSVGLSLVLASTIANPLSDLALAAELGRDKNARKMSPSRIRIPDLTARPDEIGRLSGALRGMVMALYDRIESNEQFAADVSHEIKNPLASLRSAVGTLRIATRQDQRERLLDVIDHDVRRLDRLVSDISNASRLDSELVKEDEERFDLLRMLGHLTEFHAKEAAQKGIDFIADVPKEPIYIDGLEGRLAQVFVNLITNALSFCEKGDAVRLWVRKRENRVLVVVEDTGPGIPEEALGKVFKRFYSERPVKQFGDHSGLGLAISKQIVEAHGGVIWAENIRPTDADITSEPLGARFVVGLPV